MKLQWPVCIIAASDRRYVYKILVAKPHRTVGPFQVHRITNNTLKLIPLFFSLNKQQMTKLHYIILLIA
jgi:hypothetical protein